MQKDDQSNKVHSNDGNNNSDPARTTQQSMKLSRVKNIGQFVLGDKLGEGTFGVVRLATHILTGERVAVKVLDRDKIKEQSDKIRLDREIQILKILRHNNIVHLYSVIKTSNTIYLIMEYASGKELFDYIIAKKRLNESEACRFYQQIISGIEYLHKLRIVHRDLKPENLLLNSKQELKMVDFGLSNLYKKGEMLSTSCGSPCYAAPEMIDGKNYHGVQIDIWSSGIILFAMLCGFLPFEDQNHDILYDKIREGKFLIPSFVSDTAKDLIKKILNVDPKKRYSIFQIKAHPWFNFLNPHLNINEGLLIHKNVIPIDEDLIGKMREYDYDKSEVRANILSNEHNHITTTYYLLLKKKIRKNLPSVADLNSKEFRHYLQDPENCFEKYHYSFEEVVLERSVSKTIVITEEEFDQVNNKKKGKDETYEEQSMPLPEIKEYNEKINKTPMKGQFKETSISSKRHISLIKQSLDSPKMKNNKNENHHHQNKKIPNKSQEYTKVSTMNHYNTIENRVKPKKAAIMITTPNKSSLKVNSKRIIESDLTKESNEINQSTHKHSFSLPPQQKQFFLHKDKYNERIMTIKQENTKTMTNGNYKGSTPTMSSYKQNKITRMIGNKKLKKFKPQTKTSKTINTITLDFESSYDPLQTEINGYNDDYESPNKIIDKNSNTKVNDEILEIDQEENPNSPRDNNQSHYNSIKSSQNQNKVKDDDYFNQSQPQPKMEILLTENTSSNHKYTLNPLLKMKKINSFKLKTHPKPTIKSTSKEKNTLNSLDYDQFHPSLHHFKTMSNNPKETNLSKFTYKFRVYNPKHNDTKNKIVTNKLTQNQYKISKEHKYLNTSDNSFDKTNEQHTKNTIQKNAYNTIEMDINVEVSHKEEHEKKNETMKEFKTINQGKPKPIAPKEKVMKNQPLKKQNTQKNSQISSARVDHETQLQTFRGINRKSTNEVMYHSQNNEDKKMIMKNNNSQGQKDKKIKKCSCPFDLSCVLFKSFQTVKELIQKAMTQSKIRTKNPLVCIRFI